ncbi:hypothetical protein GCM10007140_13660 [Priestia taiwanensis]|uniref:Uncharacterized protein n=1 Tax=Priestia taiwanensis TaxID=1347902 RepID=A0A917API7_9BACI|nr:hypothetical protein GCM10007140_13660 [Priestia taiwanensis]
MRKCSKSNFLKGDVIIKKKLFAALAVFTLSMGSISANVEKGNCPGPICTYVKGKWECEYNLERLY